MQNQARYLFRRDALAAHRVDLRGQLRGSADKFRAVTHQLREKNDDAPAQQLRLRPAVRHQLPHIFRVAFQRQLTIFNVTPDAGERRLAAAALVLYQRKAGIHRAADGRRARDAAEHIVGKLLPQMVHQQNGDGIRVIAHGTDALERVDDDEPGLRMLLQELLDLFHQPVMELLGHDGEVQRGRRVLREIKEPALDTLKAVLQTEVQHLAWPCGECPERLAQIGRAHV